ncbi:unnamed protein product [Nesidiocoris tenuis]|uniref:Uncharacterized protein n=1 Tax=Nesidiocoris tenuis TaxID=355587 RepID=A0A6H5HLF4_9HEMI|nr:unnamed protein product [Nesidiocoris tenuis]
MGRADSGRLGHAHRAANRRDGRSPPEGRTRGRAPSMRRSAMVGGTEPAAGRVRRRPSRIASRRRVRTGNWDDCAPPGPSVSVRTFRGLTICFFADFCRFLSIDE